jgi:prepilin-type N-terminal cleavage/methylation domain-containing protein
MLKKNQNGFTIIEVLMVLAIAGVIMLIVFLAVPALQRNSRNTQRKNDVSAILGGISEYASNNAGKVPDTNALLTQNIKLGYIDAADVIPKNIASGVVTPAVTTFDPTAATKNQVWVAYGVKCQQGTPGTTTLTDASKRNVAIQYMIESGSTNIAACQDS